MPSLQVSPETMRLIKVLRSWTELSESMDPNIKRPKKYSLDAALRKALEGMALPMELPKATVEKIKRGDKIVLSEV